MRKFYFEIKEGQSGLLVDGRHYEVRSISSITMCSDGTLRYGDVYLNIEGLSYKIRISEFVDNVKTIGDLTIERDDEREER